MVYALGFVIALAIGITGVGGGTITVPVLILFLNLAPEKTVGTALAFAAAVKILVAPVYMARKQVNYRVLALMIAGGLPGLFVGLYFLHRLHSSRQNALLTILLGAVIARAGCLGSCCPSALRSGFRRRVLAQLERSRC
jgi:uncharacterized protein